MNLCRSPKEIWYFSLISFNLFWFVWFEVCVYPAPVQGVHAIRRLGLSDVRALKMGIFQRYVSLPEGTPGKNNMEHKIHPIEKENHLPSHHFQYFQV